MWGALATRFPAGVENRTRKVEPLLDVHRIGRVLQGDAHLLGDRHEEIVEDLQHHRIDRGADGDPIGPCSATIALDGHQFALRRNRRCLPAGFDDRRRRRLSVTIAGPVIDLPGRRNRRAHRIGRILQTAPAKTASTTAARAPPRPGARPRLPHRPTACAATACATAASNGGGATDRLDGDQSRPTSAGIGHGTKPKRASRCWRA